MIKATDYEILRGIAANGRVSIHLQRKPVKVATLINEAAFLDGQFLIHHHTVFLEDQFHDWTWENGKFRYFTRVAQQADVLIVYETADVPPPHRFDPMTGERIEQNQGT